MSEYRTCEHIKTNGSPCGCPAMHNVRFCYFHQRERGRTRNIVRAFEARRAYFRKHVTTEKITALTGSSNLHDTFTDNLFASLDLPPFEDATSIQQSLALVFRAIATGQLTGPRSSHMLGILRLAIRNQGQFQLEQDKRKQVSTIDEQPIVALENNGDLPSALSLGSSGEYFVKDPTEAVDHAEQAVVQPVDVTAEVEEVGVEKDVLQGTVQTEVEEVLEGIVEEAVEEIVGQVEVTSEPVTVAEATLTSDVALESPANQTSLITNDSHDESPDLASGVAVEPITGQISQITNGSPAPDDILEHLAALLSTAELPPVPHETAGT